MNRKRVYRIYREEQLAVRRKRRKRVAAAPREALAVPSGPNQRWSMDFMADTLADGRTFRTLNVVDDGTRECVAIEVGRSKSFPPTDPDGRPRRGRPRTFGNPKRRHRLRRQTLPRIDRNALLPGSCSALSGGF